jgi:hypothetical protein
MKKNAAKPAATRGSTTAPKGAATKGTRARGSRAGSKNILSAGIKALGNAGEEAIARQSRVFETLLGIGPKAAAEAAPRGAPPASSPLAAALDPFGFRKFEDVFDQRVSRALENLGAPSAEAFAALTAEVERLRATVAALEARSKKR